jgi:membrane protease subunit HflK
MPWQQGGGSGGPWGGGSGGSGGGSGGGGGPWGRGGSGGQPPGNGGGGGGQSPFGGGRRPNDLEDLIRRGQDRMRRFIPSGGMGGKGLLIAVVVLIGLWALTGFYRVEPGEQGVILRFGEWVNYGGIGADGQPIKDEDGNNVEGPTGPGLHWHLPWPIETAETPNVEQVRQIDIGFASTASGRKTDRLEESLMLTGDQNIIDIEFTVQWRVANPGQFLFNLRNPEDTIKAVAESAMREVMGQTDIQPALTEAREEVAAKTRALIQGILDSYRAGVQITGLSLQDAQAPGQVIDAFEDVQRAQQDRDRARNEAEAYRNKVVPEARGEAAQLIQQAQAYKEQVIRESEGEAQRFMLVYAEYAKAPDLTRQRIYIETLQGVLAKTQKMILDPTLQGTVPYLPLNELRPKTSQ